MVNILSKNLCEYCFAEIETQPCPKCGYQRSTYEHDKSVLPVGSVLESRYMIGKVLGKGGFGITYLAYDMKLGYKVAIKEYYPMGAAVRNAENMTVSAHSADTEEIFKSGAEKFYNEARLVAELSRNHNIVNVSDVFYENDTVYFTMGYLEGLTLKNYLNKYGKISEEQAVYVAGEVANALASAHEINVLHRDISPDNIMVCTYGAVTLLDFGAARQVVSEASSSLSIILKQGFAPLEQYQKKGKQGPWTDIYALGATIYYLLTKDLMEDPITRMDDDEEFSSNKHGISPALWEIIKKATMIRTSERYQNIYEFMDALDDCGIAPKPLIKTDKRARSFGSMSRTKMEYKEPEAAPVPAMEKTVALNDAPVPAMEKTVALNDAPVPAMEKTVALNDAPVPAMEKTVALNDAPVPAMEKTVALNDTPTPAMNATVVLNDTPVPAMEKTVALNDTPVPAMTPTVALNDTPTSAMNPTVALDSAASQRNSPPPRQSAASERDNSPLFRDEESPSNWSRDLSDIRTPLFRDEESPSRSSAASSDSRSSPSKPRNSYFNIDKPLFRDSETDDMPYDGYIMENRQDRDRASLYNYNAFKNGVIINKYKAFNINVKVPYEINGIDVVTIGTEAFSKCRTIVNVDMPYTLNVIESRAFADCVNLRNIYIPGSLTEIGDGAFSGCKNLKQIYIPDSVERLGESAFRNCKSLETVFIPHLVSNIRQFTFENCSHLTILKIAEGTAVISKYAFKSCTSLATLNIPSSMKLIEDHAFDGCTSLRSVIIPANCKASRNAFSNCPCVRIQYK